MDKRLRDEKVEGKSVEQLEAEVKRLQELVSAAEQDKENNAKFWAQISYELRNSVNGIIGMSNLWKNEIYDIDNVKEGFEKIQDCSKALMGITNGIIDYTTIGNQSVSLKENHFNLKDLINQLTTEIHDKAAEQNKEFYVYVQGVLDEELLGDEMRLNQILSCLMNGFLKMTPKKGQMDFVLSQITSSGGNAYMRFSMKISGEELQREKIKRYVGHIISNDSNRFQWGYEGNDIDLYVCTYFIHMMNGNVFIKEHGENEFEMILDLEFKKVKKDLDNEQSSFYRNDRILIVTDDRDVCVARGKSLQKMGIEYNYATQADEALDKIGEAENEGHPYCVCIVDWYTKSFSIQNLIQDIYSIFGHELVIVATMYDTINGAKEAKRIGVNYVIEQVWFRSTIFDTLMKIKKKQIGNLEEDIFSEHAYDFEGKNVLVAEDMQLNMEVVRKILSRAKIQVFGVENGLEAVQIYENKPAGYFDCVLMDVNMPIMDGYTACRTIRNSNKADAKEIPIYAMTANAFAEDIVEALDAGMNGHIAKPVEFDVLFRTLEKVFEQRDEKERESAQIRQQVAKFEEKNAKLEKQNKELRIRAERDPLTNLLNRYGFEKKVNKLLQSHEPIGFLLVDIDHFKNINDNYGHDVGDQALVKVAEMLKNKFRTTDDIVRFGGDEFAVILNGFSGEQEFVVRKINEINEELMRPEDGLPEMSLSAGVTFSEKGYHHNLYQMSDRVLYQVKHNGRCGCIISTEVLEDMETTTENPWNRSWYSEEVYYARGDKGELVEDKQAYIDMLLGNNYAVGLIAGFYEEGLPVYSITGFTLKNLGYDFEEFYEKTGDMFEDIIFHEDIPIIHRNQESDEMTQNRIRLIDKDGKIIWYEMLQVNIRSVKGDRMWLISLRFIDDYITGELCENDYDVVGVIDCKQDIIVFERGDALVPGYSLVRRKKYNYTSLIELIGKNSVKETEYDEFITNACLKNLEMKLKSQGLYEFVNYCIEKNGTYAAMRFKVRYIDDKNEKMLCTRELVERWAENDDMTGVLNENGFYLNAGKLLEHSQDDMKYALLYFDVKGFKAWNELLGYQGANILLNRIANKLLNSFLSPYLVGRLMADHFVCLVNQKLIDYKKLTKLCSWKEEVQGSRVNLRLHCGIYLVTDKRQKVRSMCDRAMLAETHITNEFAIPYAQFSDDMDDAYINQLTYLNNLEHALQKEEFQVYYQPIFDAKTKKIVSAEALIRWILPGNKIVPPGMFIPALEEKGYIAQLDYFVENTTQAFLEERDAVGKKYVPVSMNLSRMDFINDVFVEKLQNNVSKTSLDHRYLRFEVTESAYVDVGEGGNDLLTQLRNSGSEILIDDFGTGYSSLENLLGIEFDILKLDMVFIRGIGKNPHAEEIIRSVIKACHKLGIRVIAEGVEIEEQYQFLLESECDYIQGYYFSKPLSQVEFGQLLDVNQ